VATTDEDREPSDLAARKPIHEVQRQSLHVLAEAANERERHGSISPKTKEKLRSAALAYLWALRPYQSAAPDTWESLGLDRLLTLSRDRVTVETPSAGRGDAGSETIQQTRLAEASAEQLEEYHDKLWTFATDECGFGADVSTTTGIDADPF